jgi:chromosome segregation ATPase
MSETTQEQEVPETVETPSEDNELAHLDDRTRSEIKALRREAADRRVKNKELNSELENLRTEQQKIKENKLKEDGKLNELLTEKEKELEELKPLKDKITDYEKHFTEQLETVKSKLDKPLQDLIDESGMPLAKKLKWALQLADQKRPSSSPDSQRPGGEPTTADINMADYSGPSGRKKLVMLKNTNPTLYKQVMDLKK